MLALVVYSVFSVQAGPFPAGDHTRTLRVDGRDRSYIVHVPPGLDALLWAFFEQHPRA